MNISGVYNRRSIGVFDVFFFGILAIDVVLIGFAVHNLSDGLSRGSKAAVSSVVPVPQEVPAVLESAAPPAQEQRPSAVVPNKSRIIDNFFEQAVNGLGGKRSVSTFYGGVLRSEILPGTKNRKYALIDYDVTSVGSEAVFATDIKGLDLSGFEALVLDLRGITGDEVFKVELKDEKNGRSISSSEIYPDSVPKRFQSVAIPLKNFGAIGESVVKNGKVSLIFSNSMGMPYKGSICLRRVSVRKAQ